MLNRKLVIASILNLLLALPHLLSPRMGVFRWQRFALAFARVIHGVIEFLAFVFSTMVSIPDDVAIFLAISLFGPLAIFLAWRMWRSSDDARLVVAYGIVFNLLFGAVSSWAGALLVGAPKQCETAMEVQRRVRVVEYTEIGWLPEIHYFLAVSSSEGATWHQAAMVSREEPVPEPCDDIRRLFPQLDELLEGKDASSILIELDQPSVSLLHPVSISSGRVGGRKVMTTCSLNLDKEATS